MTTAVERFGGLDVLVWNGGGPPPGTARDADEASLESAYRLLLRPAVTLVRLCLGHLERSPAGPDRRHHVARGPGAHDAPRALEHVPARAHRLAEDAQPGGRPEGDHRQLRRARPDRDGEARRALSRRPERRAARGDRAPAVGNAARVRRRRLLPRLRPRSLRHRADSRRRRRTEAVPVLRRHLSPWRVLGGRSRPRLRRARDPLRRPLRRLPRPGAEVHPAPGRRPSRLPARQRAGSPSRQARQPLLRRRDRAPGEHARGALSVASSTRDARAGRRDRPSLRLCGAGRSGSAAGDVVLPARRGGRRAAQARLQRRGQADRGRRLAADRRHARSVPPAADGRGRLRRRQADPDRGLPARGTGTRAAGSRGQAAASCEAGAP